MYIVSGTIYTTYITSLLSPYPVGMFRANVDRAAVQYNRDGRPEEDWGTRLLSYLMLLDPPAGNTESNRAISAMYAITIAYTSLESDKNILVEGTNSQAPLLPLF